MTFKNHIFTTIVILTVLFLSGCTTSPRTLPSTTPEKVSAAQQYYSQAIQLLKNNNLNAATQQFEFITQQYPAHSAAHINLGIIHIRQQNYIVAETHFNKAIELNPDSAHAYHHLGITYRLLGKFKEAENAYKKAINLKSDYANAYLNLGILYDIYLDKPEFALRLYQKYQELTNPQSDKVKKWIAEIKRRIPKTVNRIQPSPNKGMQHG